jgi:hypothetical protein
MKQFLTFSLVVIFGAFFAACQAPQQANRAESGDSNQMMADQDLPANMAGETSMAVEDPFQPTLEAQLTDVTEGNDLSEGINTGGAAVGVAQAGLTEDGGYLLQAEIVGLPELPADYFYEGWIVNKDVSPFSVISTGELDNEDGVTYTNVYTSDSDYTDHLEYVLTLEPRDDDPAPAEHVVDGIFQEI